MSNIVIIGSGPAGVSAALYAVRAGVQTTVLTKGPGALDRAELIQNYYGFAEPIAGAELERRGIEGAKAVGVEFVTTEAVGLTYTDKLTVETLAGDFPADAVILATGASRAAPRIPGLAGLEGHGVRAVVDATQDLLVNVLPYHPFLIKPNNHELGEIVGRELKTDEEITAAARALQEKGALNVLVSMAGDGALLLDEKGEVHRIGTPKGKVVNSVGAGDSMVAGFVAGYLRSGSYLEALRLGTACGSATAFSLGLAKKEKITLDDLKGENLMLMKRGWSYYGDKLRDFIAVKNPDINIVDFDLYNIEAFNRCENNNEVLLAFKSWESVHPLIRIIPVEWDYTMPFGILHSKEPSEKVRRLIKAINKIKA